MQSNHWIIEILISYSDIRLERETRERLGMDPEEYEIYKVFEQGIDDVWLMISDKKKEGD